MNILIISQCQKNALKTTRKILDQFAERCGNRTWQTAITQNGLKTLYQLLSQTARKNTAIACHWIHGKNYSELLWIIGNKQQFNERGRVPTKISKTNTLTQQKEPPFKQSYTIKLISALAALLHDLGKSSIGFQNKLTQKNAPQADPFRHEWISVRIFEAMIEGCKNDEEWLKRLADWRNYQQKNPQWIQKLKKDKIPRQNNILHLPPLAKLLIWLIATHHRNMALKETQKNDSITDQLYLIYRNFNPYENWVYQPQSNHKTPDNFWEFKQLASESQKWQSQMKRWANKTLKHHPLMNELSQKQNINTEKAEHYLADPLLLLLTRLSLMTGDHSYSSQNPNHKLNDKNITLFANTTQQKQGKQHLDEHLIGVCQKSVHFAHQLPKIMTSMPKLQHPYFKKNSTNQRFHWQNKAYQLAKTLQNPSETQGFFGINMASTGSGKTLGNARIMYALQDPEEGARITIALGLRTLTLQTGQALQEKLKLTNDMIATLIGNSPAQTQNEYEKTGNESSENWLENWQIIGGHIQNNDQEFLKPWQSLQQNKKQQILLNTPLISCTIDHLMQATETLRGGKYIIPSLRLISSDLILDEPDDFSQKDLPALTRLIYHAGLLGSRILLSSATLPPDLLQGFFEAYQAGRKIWNQNHNYKNNTIPCAWFDEFSQQKETCKDPYHFAEHHHHFAQKRAQKLQKQTIRRKAHILNLTNTAKENQPINYPQIAEQLCQQALEFHHRFSLTDPNTQKQISLGLIRFANIKNIIPITQAFMQQKIPNNLQIHLVCYHSRQLLCIRNKLEQKLDRLLNRQNNPPYTQEEIRSTLENSPYQHHLYIIIGSPITEIGRDHDYDWAIIEPSSMRSIIQLAGRIWRHRPEKEAIESNLAILHTNLRSLGAINQEPPQKASFYHPGYENKNHLLITHDIKQLIPEKQLQHINAIPRIINAQTKPLDPKYNRPQTLSDLEHIIMKEDLNNPEKNNINGYFRGESKFLTTAYPQKTPFRETQPQEDYICLPDEESNWRYSMAYNADAQKHINKLEDCPRQRHLFHYQEINNHNPQIKPWLITNLDDCLEELKETNEQNIAFLAFKHARISLDKYENAQPWLYNEFFGFWKS